MYSIMMFYQQYLSWSGYYDEPQSAATTIIGIGEALTTTCLCLLATAIVINRDLTINYMNEMIKYDRNMISKNLSVSYSNMLSVLNLFKRGS